MGFAPINYSLMFDKINELTDKNKIVKELKSSTGKKKKYLEELFDISEVHKGKPIWRLCDLEKFFNTSLEVVPFFRPEFFIGGWDYNGSTKHGFYVTACGLKKVILILMQKEQIKLK